MDKKEKDKKIDARWIRLACCVVFYLAFCFVFGVQMGADSRGYINMVSAREPVYPLFLWAFRSLFGENLYLWIVIILRNLSSVSASPGMS